MEAWSLYISMNSKDQYNYVLLTFTIFVSEWVSELSNNIFTHWAIYKIKLDLPHLYSALNKKVQFSFKETKILKTKMVRGEC